MLILKLLWDKCINSAIGNTADLAALRKVGGGIRLMYCLQVRYLFLDFAVSRINWVPEASKPYLRGALY